MSEEFVRMIQEQNYNSLTFILILGMIVVAAILSYVFFLTRKQKSPHER